MKYKSYFFIILSGILWGLISLFRNGLAEQGLGRIQIAALRMLTGALFLFLYCLLTNCRLSIKAKDLWCFIGSGFVSVLLMNICYFYSIEKNGVSVASILLYTSPVFVTLLSAAIFREKLNIFKTVSLPVALTGIILCVGLTGLHFERLADILIGIGAGFTYALYSIFSRFAINKGYTAEAVSFYTFLFSGCGLLVISVITEPGYIFNSSVAFNTFGIGVICCLLPFLLYTKGLEKVENSKAGVIVTVEPVTATLVGIFVFNESFHLINLIGIILIFVSIILVSVNFNGKDKDAS